VHLTRDLLKKKEYNGYNVNRNVQGVPEESEKRKEIEKAFPTRTIKEKTSIGDIVTTRWLDRKMI